MGFSCDVTGNRRVNDADVYSSRSFGVAYATFQNLPAFCGEMFVITESRYLFVIYTNIGRLIPRGTPQRSPNNNAKQTSFCFVDNTVDDSTPLEIRFPFGSHTPEERGIRAVAARSRYLSRACPCRGSLGTWTDGRSHLQFDSVSCSPSVGCVAGSSRGGSSWNRFAEPGAEVPQGCALAPPTRFPSASTGKTLIAGLIRCGDVHLRGCARAVGCQMLLASYLSVCAAAILIFVTNYLLFPPMKYRSRYSTLLLNVCITSTKWNKF